MVGHKIYTTIFVVHLCSTHGKLFYLFVTSLGRVYILSSPTLTVKMPSNRPKQRLVILIIMTMLQTNKITQKGRNGREITK